MMFGLLNGGEDADYNGVDSVGIAHVFTIQDAFSIGTVPFESFEKINSAQNNLLTQHHSVIPIS